MMSFNPFQNSERQLRNGWWILIFFLVLASLLAPALIAAQKNSMDVSIGLQTVIIMIASLICQALQKSSFTELSGKLNLRWLKEFGVGSLIGSALMLIPALTMWLFGWVDLQWNLAGFSSFLPAVLLFAQVALAEELLFRGFIFQRLIAGVGQLPAQLLIAGYFLLTHLDNPGMTGNVKVLAGINIFMASLLFGLTCIRAKSLAMPLGLHFMANLMQGGALGFGVSGAEQAGLLKPVFGTAPIWLTGGEFGLEASLLGLICVALTLILTHKWMYKKHNAV